MRVLQNEELLTSRTGQTGEQRFAFLAEVSHVLSASLDYRETLSRLARLVVPALADSCILDVFDEEGRIERVEAIHKDPARQPLLDALKAHPPEVAARMGMGQLLRTGQPVLTPEVTDEMLRTSVSDPEHQRLLLQVRARSSIMVPLISHGRILGGLGLAITDGDRRYTPADLALAEELGYRAALAVDNARLFQGAQRLEQELRRRVEELAATNRGKDELIAMLAHELRNPLAAISNAGNVLGHLLAGDGDRRAAELVAIIDRQLRHLSRLVDDLLDVSRFTRGRIELRKAPVEIHNLVKEAVETVQPLVEQKRQQLRVSLSGEPLWVEADTTRIEQVLANLLTNAVKFTDPGGRIDLTAGRQDGELVLSVRDNGAGIPAELLPRIFDLFVQEDRSLARSQGGLGIGLTLVRTLVEHHGGRVEAHSDGPGTGTEMTVRLPLLEAPGTAQELRPAAAPAAGSEGSVRLLLVEDNVDAAEALAELLRLWGHEVQVVHDGAAAVDAVRLHRPDVVLLDIGLPGMDGYEVAASLRAEPELRPHRMIALTGYGQEADRHRSRNAGFDHHLVKPVNLEELRALVVGPPSPRWL